MTMCRVGGINLKTLRFQAAELTAAGVALSPLYTLFMITLPPGWPAVSFLAPLFRASLTWQGLPGPAISHWAAQHCQSILEKYLVVLPSTHSFS